MYDGTNECNMGTHAMKRRKDWSLEEQPMLAEMLNKYRAVAAGLD